jgi:hypothetical chaperone protein
MIVGLDFGTSNSAVATQEGRVLPLVPPSVLFRSVLFFPDDSREVWSGAAAIDEYLQRSTGRFIQSIKTWLPSASFHSTQIRNRPYRLDDLVAILLRRLRELAEPLAGAPVDRVVPGRPARFSEDPDEDARAEARLLAAAKLAGFTDVHLLIEPIAAALAYEASLNKDELVLVADFGAGTSDLTLMKVGPSRRGAGDRRADVIASHGVRIGGDRFDSAIMRHKLLPLFGEGSTYETMGKRMEVPMAILGKLLSWHEMSFIKERSTQQLLDRMLQSSDRPEAIQALIDLVEENLGFRLFRAIEAAKIELSDRPRTRLRFDEAAIQLDVALERGAVEKMWQPLLDQLDAAVDELLGRAQVDLATIDAIFLTGGSSQIPAVRERIVRRFGADRLRSADAFSSVAAGLGHAARALS